MWDSFSTSAGEQEKFEEPEAGGFWSFNALARIKIEWIE
jgi:hypothetical protein